jgi:hypothetical protein
MNTDKRRLKQSLYPRSSAFICGWKWPFGILLESGAVSAGAAAACGFISA